MTETAIPAKPTLAPRATRANIEGVFALRALQKAMLMHHAPPPAADPGFLAVRFSLQGVLDLAAYENAWRTVVRRHASLRMSLRPLADKDPRIVVWREVDLPWTVLDWRQWSAQQQQQGLQQLLDDDSQRGIDLNAAPVMRVTVLRLAAEQHQVVWACHHLFLDGWSAAIVVQEVLALYQAGKGIGEPPPAPPYLGYGDYLSWLKRQPAERAADFWRQRLAGFDATPPLQLRPIEPQAVASVYGKLALGTALSASIAQFCAAHQLTANALFQTGWAILLAHLSGDDDVVFGVTVSGRSAPLDGMERMVGLFSNVVPVRIRLQAQRPIIEQLRQQRDAQFDLQSFEYSTLVDIRAASEVPGARPLFESLLVIENFPFEPARPDSAAPQMSGFASGLTSTLPLTLAWANDNGWRLHCRYDAQRFEPIAIAALQQDYRAVLQAMVTDSQRSVDALRDAVRFALLPASADESAALAAVRGAGSGDDADSAGLPARNPTELRLAQLWEQVLGQSPVGVTDDFFALGGTSLVAVQLFDRIAAAFGRELPLTLLLQHPTIASLATVLDGASMPAWRCLVPIQTGGSQPPLICVHAGAGHVLMYHHLARRLGPDQPVYGLQSLGLQGDEAPLDEIQAMAALYIEELRSIQPHGPYLLAGYCSGATVCLVMARQLEQQGEQTALIIALDSGPPPLSGPLRRVVGNARQTRWNWGRGIWRRIYQRLIRPQLLKHGSPVLRRRLRMDMIEQAAWRAYRGYTPERCQAPITLIRASDTVTLENKRFHLDWQSLSAGLTVEEAGVKHASMMLEPEIATVAELVAAAIRRALPSGRS